MHAAPDFEPGTLNIELALRALVQTPCGTFIRPFSITAICQRAASQNHKARPEYFGTPSSTWPETFRNHQLSPINRSHLAPASIGPILRPANPKTQINISIIFQIPSLLTFQRCNLVTLQLFQLCNDFRSFRHSATRPDVPVSVVRIPRSNDLATLKP